MAEIVFENVAFTYDGQANALDGISFSIERGEFVCFVGGNGSGKSTLAKHMNGLLVPDSGTVRVGGVPTSDKAGIYAARQHVGLVFQNPDDALVETLVADDVAFGPRNLGLNPAEVQTRVDKALANVGLEGWANHDTVLLSGGQKQRVAIAGMLAMNPSVLVLDEATAMLDPSGKTDILRTAKSLHASGMTVIAITHSMEEVLSLATRVIALDAGHVAFDGTPEGLFANAALIEALHLELPYALKLRHALAKKGVKVNAPLNATAEELAQALAN